MSPGKDISNNRILTIDDNPAIHDDIRKILTNRTGTNAEMADTKAMLFGDGPAVPEQPEFDIDSAFQGEEGLLKVKEAIEAGCPYAMAFVDVRLPPGWDGIETVARIWQAYPDLQVVICTAYPDYSWEEMVKHLGGSDSMVLLKKPFDTIEVVQLAHALTRKWVLNRQVRRQLNNLDHLVALCTTELRR